MDALDLAAVLEMADMLGIGGIERLVFQESGQLRLGLTAQARLLLLAAFGLDAFVLFLLRADRVGLGQVDVLARALLALMLLLAGMRGPALRAARGMRFRLAGSGLAGIGLRRMRRLVVRLAFRFRRGLEAHAQQGIAQGIAHG